MYNVHVHRHQNTWTVIHNTCTCTCMCTLLYIHVHVHLYIIHVYLYIHSKYMYMYMYEFVGSCIHVHVWCTVCLYHKEDCWFHSHLGYLTLRFLRKHHKTHTTFMHVLHVYVHVHVHGHGSHCYICIYMYMLQYASKKPSHKRSVQRDPVLRKREMNGM